MRLVFYSPVSLRNGGGGEQWQMAIAPKLRDLFDHQIEVVACSYGDVNITLDAVKARLDGVPYTEIPVRIFAGSALPTSSAKKLLNEKFAQADAVHYVFGFMGHDMLINQLASRTSTKVYAGFHAPIFTHNKLHNLYVSTISRYLTLPHCAGFFTFNAHQEAIVKGWGLSSGCTSIAGGVDTDHFVIPKQPRPTQRLELLYLGRFEYEKGIDLLVAAIEQWLGSAEVKARMTFVGAGSYSTLVDELVKKYPKQVRRVEFTSDPLPYYQQAHLLVLPSRQETFGLAMVEALATGIPVLAGAADGPRQVLTDNKTGWLVKEPTAELIMKSLDRIYRDWLKNPASWKRWEDATRTCALQYGPATIAKRMHERFVG